MNDMSPARLAHFVQRVRERGPEGICPFDLAAEITRAVQAGDEDRAEPVRAESKHDHRTIYRVKLGDHGIYYAVVCDLTGEPITLFDQQMFSRIRQGRKHARRMRRAGRGIEA